MFSAIRVRNFQSLQNLELDLGHLTAIVGPTNVGKSAFIRAVTAAVDNRRGDSFIMDGTDFCCVELITCAPSGSFVRSVSWQKYRKKGGEYSYNGDKVIDEAQFIVFTGLKTMSFAKGYFICQPNFQQQKDDDFLLSASDQFKSKILGEITNASLILLANTQIKKDSQKNSSQLSFYEQDRAEVAADLATKFVGLDAIVDLQVEAEKTFVWVGELLRSLDALVELEKEMSAVIEVHNRALAMQQVLGKVVGPKLLVVESSIKWITENTDFYNDLCRQEFSIVREVAIAQVAVNCRKIIETMPGLGNLEQRITDLHSLIGYDEVIADVTANISEGSVLVDSHTRVLKELDAQMVELKQQIDICPLCDTVLDKGHTHENCSNQ